MSNRRWPWAKPKTPSLRWSIVISSPRGAAGEQWGDTWFARDLADALRRRGHVARVVRKSQSDGVESDDVVLVLRGLKSVEPKPGEATWLLWVISHPEDVSRAEVESYDAVFAASSHWSFAHTGTSASITPLLQATNPRRFLSRPRKAPGEVLFVGNTRGEFRPIVRDALHIGAEPAIFGSGWESFIPESMWRGEYLDNMELPLAYARADVVLNDHWSDMAREGFLSNRLFDATAAGARIISDHVVGIEEIFGRNVRTYTNVDELRALLDSPREETFGTAQEIAEESRRIAKQHSFDARAEILEGRVLQLRGLT